MFCASSLLEEYAGHVPHLCSAQPRKGCSTRVQYVKRGFSVSVPRRSHTRSRRLTVSVLLRSSSGSDSDSDFRWSYDTYMAFSFLGLLALCFGHVVHLGRDLKSHARARACGSRIIEDLERRAGTLLGCGRALTLDPAVRVHGAISLSLGLLAV